MNDQIVYIVKAEDSGRIKIGITSNPVRRLALMQVGSPERLHLVGTAPGGRSVESRLHADLEGDRLHGEWFEATDRVITAVGDLLGWGVPTPDQVRSANRVADLRQVATQ